jgi:RNA polymerase sigma-70 factor (ECF subfamily)
MSPRGDGCFPETRWSRVARIRSDDAAVAAKALDELCAQYHYPLYCYLRRRGCAHHDAEDVLHDFLAGLVRLRALERVEAERGRLRGYLALSLGRHLREWRHRESRRERPASDFHDVLDFEVIGNRYQRERFTDADTPDRKANRASKVRPAR